MYDRLFAVFLGKRLEILGGGGWKKQKKSPPPPPPPPLSRSILNIAELLFYNENIPFLLIYLIPKRSTPNNDLYFHATTILYMDFGNVIQLIKADHLMQGSIFIGHDNCFN